ncbi:MAG: ABC transporter [Candidatus Puniceispirillum sp. TMED52]|nr:ABC transporter [SAR116 cluster bacterium]OUU49937.1 MAG: ABC transporter [Candidatus Puniceispirillum sp. TMED52]HCP19468.1 ABC transporter [Alphaproteobacteria bacterium]
MSRDDQDTVLLMNDVSKAFHQGDRVIQVLKDVSVNIKKGELVALVGPSGSGKTTLLNIAGILERPDSGQVSIAGKATHRLNDKETSELRRNSIGFVFQFHRLLPEFSAAENIIIPQIMNRLSRHVAQERAEQLLAMIGLSERRHHRPGQLSGGEQQRVAIARAVANVPSLLLADEPTGNLDPDTAADVFKHLVAILRSTGTAALLVTHNMELAKSLDRVLTIRKGELVG